MSEQAVDLQKRPARSCGGTRSSLVSSPSLGLLAGAAYIVLRPATLTSTAVVVLPASCAEQPAARTNRSPTAIWRPRS